MFENKIILLIICTFFAALPVGVWLYFMFKGENSSKKTIAAVFGLGCLTAPALLYMQVLWEKFPRFNVASFIETSIQVQNFEYIAMFMLFGALEEIIKMLVIVYIDKKTLLIRKIEDSIRYSTASALGFSFTENIYYLIVFWSQISLGELVGMYIFRSMFTMCAHMIFSAIFGYYYGIGKYSIYLRKQEEEMGKTSKITKLIAKLFKLPLSHAYQQRMVVKGLVISVVTHAMFNFLLQFNIQLPVILFVVFGFMYMRYLLNRKAGNLLLATDISSKEKSSIAKKDEEVIIELMGMWFNEKKYVDVIHICERLLERDPDNTVVKLFKAKALDKMQDKDVYKKILSTVVNTEEEVKDNSKLVNYIKLKEQRNKSKQKKDKTKEKEENVIKKPQKKPLEDLTGDGTFKL